MRVRTPVEAQEAARLLLIHGRWWFNLMEDQLARGAHILLENPAYRKAMYASAYEYARATRQGLLAASLTDAYDVLALNDESETT